MDKNLYKKKWDEYCKDEILGVKPILDGYGFILDDEQVHIGGERYLMSGHKIILRGKIKREAGRKVILTGKRKIDNKKVIIKVSSNSNGILEIEHEYSARNIINKLKFAYNTFLCPEDILFVKKGKYIIHITEYVEQKVHFIDRPIMEQFFLALQAFEAQEGAHATTYEHEKSISSIFGIAGSKEYQYSLSLFCKDIISCNPKNINLKNTLEGSMSFVDKNKNVLDKYCGFLTHTDFVPHNIRIVERDIYLLDYSSICFGNKYESWARFLNYMLHYNQPLERMLSQYVRDNRGEEEYLSLRIMRIYKIVFLLQFYSNTLNKTVDNLYDLELLRVEFWTNSLKSILNDVLVSDDDIKTFVNKKETLRSADEKRRQKEISTNK